MAAGAVAGRRHDLPLVLLAHRPRTVLRALNDSFPSSTPVGERNIVPFPRGAAVVTLGIVLTALVGLSRVYLDVHYLSDVNAGWALGAAAFSLCAAVALVISTLRQNDGRAAAAGNSEDRG